MKLEGYRRSTAGLMLAGAGALLAGALLRDGRQEATAAVVTPAASASLGYGQGYLVTDNGTGAPVLADSFIDASGGAASQFTLDDTFISVTAPFALQVFGGAPTTDLRVHDNGYLTLGTSSSSFPTNEALPTKQTGGDAMIAPFWDDLYPKATTTVYTETTGTAGSRRFVIEWNDIGHFDDQTASYQFEVVFFEQKPGEVLIQYGTMTDGTGVMADGRSATIGAQAAGGGAYTTVAVDQSGAVSSALSVDFDVDSDHDGLSDAAEDSNRDGVLDTGETDPSLFDTDGGGTGDGAEVIVQSTDPRASGDDAFADGDSDGLSDNDELVLGTNGAVADTDGDGLDDGVEVMTLGCSPLLRDTDGDLLTDFDEVDLDGDPSSYTAGTDANPAVADTDGGGMADGNEIINGLDPTDPGDDLGSVVGPAMDGPACNDQSTVSAGIDDTGNVHLVTEDRSNFNGNYLYRMLSPDGTVLIDDTEFDGLGGEPRYAKTFLLPSGHVATVWSQASTGDGSIGYRLIDPALDAQSGNAANPAVNPNSPPTVGDGVTLIERIAVQGPGSDAGYTHLDAQLDAQGNIHVMVMVRKNADRAHKTFYYTKLKGEGGTPLFVAPISVLDVVKPDGSGTDANPYEAPVHSFSGHRMFVDAQGNAYLLFASFTRGPWAGGYADLQMVRIDSSGSVATPLTQLVPAVNGHWGAHFGVAEGNVLSVFHTANVTRGQSGDMAMSRFTTDGALISPARYLDGPSVDGRKNSYQMPDAAIGAGGEIGLAYMDRFGDKGVRFALLDASGNPVLGPMTLATDHGARGRRAFKVAVAASPNREKMVIAWNHATNSMVRASIVDLSRKDLTAQALVNVTVAAGGMLAVEDPGSDLLGARATFGAADTTADTWAILQRGTSSATAPGSQVGSIAEVRFVTGGAQLAASADYSIRLPIPTGFTGDVNNVSLYQDDGGTWTQLTSTLDTSTTPPTVTATATALTRFALFESAPGLAFTSTPVTTAVAGEQYAYDAVASSSAPVGYSLVTAPSGMTIDSSGRIRWVPQNAQVGMHAVTVRASNGFAMVDQSYVIGVTLVGNTAPIFTSSPPVLLRVGDNYDYTPTVVDPDTAQALTFSLFTAPAGMSIDSATGQVTWSPTAADVGPNPVSIGVSDGIVVATQIYTVTVVGPEPPPSNRPPVFTSSPPVTAMVGQAYQYTAVATDPDAGDSLTFAVADAPGGLTIDATSGVVTWMPQASDFGTVQIDLTVSDGTATVTQAYLVTVGGDGVGDDGGCCSTGRGRTPWGGLLLAVLVGLALLPRRRRLAGGNDGSTGKTRSDIDWGNQ